MARLNIFVDETGDFGFQKRSSRLYGVSFTFHEQKDDITNELNTLNERLDRIGYYGMIHMADLTMKRGDYKKLSIQDRKSIFNAIYQFARRIPAKYKSIFIDKKYASNNKVLKQQLMYKIQEIVIKHENYFSKFSQIVMYYDNGQKELGNILNICFSNFSNFIQYNNFDHKAKRLFQVADMLTFLDKYDYKYNHKINFTSAELFFFDFSEIRKTLKELNNKRF